MRAIGIAAVACALSGAACGGSGAGAAGDAQPATPSAVPSGPRVPQGWMVVGDAAFSAHMPQGSQERAVSTPSRGRAWSGSAGGVDYVVEELDGPLDGPPEQVMTAHAERFFAGCKGELERHRRNDTLRTHTLSVVGTCGRDKRAIGEVHFHDGRLEALFVVIVGDEGAIREDEVKAFFRAFQLKSS